jgi:hypothetical protein
MSTHLIARSSTIGFSLFLILSSLAQAGSITVATDPVNRVFAANPNGKFTVFAYTEENGKVNAKNTYYTQGTPGPANTYNNDFFTIRTNNGNQKLTPVVGNKDVNKGPALFAGTIYSETGGAQGYADFTNQGNGKVYLAARGTTNPGANRIGAGKSIDPVPVDPGTYSYSYNLTFSMQVYPTDPYASFYAGASDTNHANPLWMLTAIADGPISSINDLVMTFTSDPSLGLNDAAVLNDLKAAISISDGVASLSGYTLFATTYYVSSSTDYSDEVAAATASIPEPTTFALLAIGTLAGSASLGRRKQGCRGF